jgi:S-adenosylmethionine synthetase
VNQKRYEKEIRAIYDDGLARITDLTDLIVKGKVTVF